MRATRLDTPGGRLYKARAFLGAALLTWSSGALAQQVVNGAPLPESAQKVGENRYRSAEDWKNTQDTLRKLYPPSVFPRRTIVNQPGVKAIHIVNPSGRNYEGLNIYEANDEVRFYVVPAGVLKSAKKKAAPKETTPPPQKK